jgi:hypothetical protein
MLDVNVGNVITVGLIAILAVVLIGWGSRALGMKIPYVTA